MPDLLAGVRGLILDMDGVLWRESEPVVDLPALFARFDELELKVTLATNNATRTIAEYQDKLHGYGVNIEPWQIANSSEAAGFYLKGTYPAGSRIYVIGEPSLKATLSAFGFEVDEQSWDGIVAVVSGMDRGINYEKLRRAGLLIRKGAAFIGTNPDRTFPTPQGLVPGAGSILAAIETATDVSPVICGKPQPTLYRLCMDRMALSPAQTLVVGDRLETDIAGGQALGCRTAIVLSGVSTEAQARAWMPAPDIIATDIEKIFST